MENKRIIAYEITTHDFFCKEFSDKKDNFKYCGKSCYVIQHNLYKFKISHNQAILFGSINKLVLYKGELYVTTKEMDMSFFMAAVDTTPKDVELWRSFIWKVY